MWNWKYLCAGLIQKWKGFSMEITFLNSYFQHKLIKN